MPARLPKPYPLGTKISRALTTTRTIKVPNPDITTSLLIDVQEQVTYDVYVDYDKVREMAKSGAQRKDRISRVGPVAVVVVKKERVEE